MNPFAQQARELIEQNTGLRQRAPEFGGDKAWLNTRRPLSLSEDLEGKIVLLHFWTAGSIECHRSTLALDRLARRYAGQPFAIVGCHSARFPCDAPARAVCEAVLREGIEHPVLVDVGSDVARRYAIREWPTLVLISPEANVIATFAGTGHMDAVEALVDAALPHFGRKGVLDDSPLPMAPERNRSLPRELEYPRRAVYDGARNLLFVADTGHHRVVALAPDGAFVRAFGSGEPGAADGPAALARFQRPLGLAAGDGALFVADSDQGLVRRIDLASGDVATIARGGDAPSDLALRGAELFVSMTGARQVWRLDLATGAWAPFAGSGRNELRDGSLADCAFAAPAGLALLENVLFVADAEACAIRAIDLESATVRTLAGGGAANGARDAVCGDHDGAGRGRRFQRPLGICAHGGLLFVADSGNHRIRQVDPSTGFVATLAGLARPGCVDGPAEDAGFHEPSGICADRGLLFVADSSNHRIRVVDAAGEAVSSLRLRGVPLPPTSIVRAARTDELTRGLPDLPDTHVHARVNARVLPGECEIALQIALPQGAMLADGAPSQFRVRRIEGSIDPEQPAGKIRAPSFGVPLYVDGPGELELTAVYYVRAAGGECRMRSARWRLEVEVAADGSDRIELIDAP